MRNLRLFNLKIVLAFFAVLTTAYAQDPTAYLTPDIDRVGSRLACRCGACANTVRDCAMFPHCGFCSAKRKQIHDMQQRGMSDDAIVNTFVKEEGIVALASPPTHGFLPIVTWIGPGVALLLGFGVYSWYVRRNRQKPDPLMPVDQAVLDRFKAQIDRELDDSPLKK
jgi:cytochrome c-type biogenesis protein CcmH/NrfF